MAIVNLDVEQKPAETVLDYYSRIVTSEDDLDDLYDKVGCLVTRVSHIHRAISLDMSNLKIQVDMFSNYLQTFLLDGELPLTLLQVGQSTEIFKR